MVEVLNHIKNNIWVYRALLFVMFFLVLRPVFGQGLQGPFVPIQVNGVTQSAGVAGVNVTYEAQLIGGGSVFGNGTTSFTEAEATAQAVKKVDDINGADLERRLMDDGYNKNGAGDGFDSDTSNPPGYDDLGTCGSTPNTSLSVCVADTKAALELIAIREWVGLVCSTTGNQVWLRILTGSPPSSGTEGTWAIWSPPAGNTICDDSPGLELPDPQDPIPVPGQFLDELSKPAPEIPQVPSAPDPAPPGTAPPMASPRFYSQSASSSFDMSIANSSGDSFTDISLALTNSYETHTSTTTNPSPLPNGLSFSPDPVDTSGAFDAPVGGEGSDQCVDFPNSLGCADVENDSVSFIESTLPALPNLTDDIGESFTPVAVASVAGCPAPVVAAAFGTTFDMTYQPMCDAAVLFNPIVLLISTIIGLYIVIGYKSA